MKKLPYIILILLMLTTVAFPAMLYAGGAYFYMGDGKITIGRGKPKTIRFRNADGTYNIAGLKAINSLYGTDYNRSESRMSLRLIELLDYIEDTLGGKGIKIVSGYRSPDYNQSLRNRGKLAASSSLHIDAEAIDIIMNGVASSKIYDFLYQKDCCGIGYYHGKTIHIDDGPPRFWDEKTSGTEKKEPPENEHIVLKTKSDIYHSLNRVGLKFSRVTDYPIGVRKEMKLICKEGGNAYVKRFSPSFENSVKSEEKGCYLLKNRREGRTIFAPLPTGFPKKGPAECIIKATFCEPKTAKMPRGVVSNGFIVKK